MGSVTSEVDPMVLFDRWFDRAISQLEKMENGDGGTAGMMIVLPLFERYVDILEENDPSGRKRYEILASELQLKTPLEAEKFWTTLRHGFCHVGMPLKRGRRLKTLPKVYFAAQYSHLPEFQTAPNGEERLCLDPWKFIHYVMSIYRRDPVLLIRHPDAPLLGIHIFT